MNQMIETSRIIFKEKRKLKCVPKEVKMERILRRILLGEKQLQRLKKMWSNNKTIPEEVKEMNTLVIRNQNLQESQRIMLVISLRRKQVNGRRKNVSSLIIFTRLMEGIGQECQSLFQLEHQNKFALMHKNISRKNKNIKKNKGLEIKLQPELREEKGSPQGTENKLNFYMIQTMLLLRPVFEVREIRRKAQKRIEKIKNKRSPRSPTNPLQRPNLLQNDQLRTEQKYFQFFQNKNIHKKSELISLIFKEFLIYIQGIDSKVS